MRIPVQRPAVDRWRAAGNRWSPWGLALLALSVLAAVVFGCCGRG